MESLPLRIPDEQHQRFKESIRSKNVSVNKLLEELTTMVLAEYDLETRFRVRISKGSREKVLEVLDKLQQDFAD
ncbi:MAG: toxin-antitoxin system HicB family antitoxin [Cyanobacteria bacterium P01_F01_bin.143]